MNTINNPLRQECSTLLQEAKRYGAKLTIIQQKRVTLGAADWSIVEIAEHEGVKQESVASTLRRAERRVEAAMPKQRVQILKWD